MKVYPTQSEDLRKSTASSIEFQREDDHLMSTKNVIKEKNKSICSGCFSVKVAIVFLVACLVIACAFFVWLASFFGARNALGDMTTRLMHTFGDFVFAEMDAYFNPFIQVGQEVAYDYNIGLVSNISLEMISKYLMKKHLLVNSFGLGLYMTEELKGVVLNPPNSTLSFNTQIGSYSINSTTNTIIPSTIRHYSFFNSTQQSFWTASFKLMDSLGRDSVFGTPYYSLSGAYTLYYSAKIFDPILYASGLGVKKVLGIVKVNISLQAVQEFLKRLHLMNTGYVIVAETNDLVIGGSINTTAINPASRVSVFELQDRNAGALMKQIAENYKNLSNTPTSFKISSMGVAYTIFIDLYTIENMAWNLFIVVETGEIEESINISTGITVGVAVAVAIVGIFAAVLIGHVTTSPLSHLEEEFMKIKLMEFDKVNFISSTFKEVDNIFLYLREMTVWLNEIKSFVPESVFLQLQNLTGENGRNATGYEVDETGSNASASNNQMMHSVGSSNHSKQQLKNTDANSLFKIGLSLKNCSIIRIHLTNFTKDFTGEEITHLFSKISSGLSSVSKTIQANFQVLSVDEYQITITSDSSDTRIKSVSQVALESSLKFLKLIANINGTTLNNRGVRINCCIGVSSGKSLCGNLGSSSFRSFFAVGGAIENAKTLTILANEFKCQLLADSKTLNENTLPLFVVRPVSRLLLEPYQHEQNESMNVSNIYEVIKENNVEKDEWMYELQQKESNEKYKEYCTFFLFDRLEQFGNDDDLYEALTLTCEKLSSYIENNIDDRAAIKLWEVLKYFLKQGYRECEEPLDQLLSKFHSTLHYTLRNNFP
ncbi:hypothetical protein ABK040_001928 [Willaertia magna]